MNYYCTLSRLCIRVEMNRMGGLHYRWEKPGTPPAPYNVRVCAAGGKANPSPSSQSPVNVSGACQMAGIRKDARREQSVTASCMAASRLGPSADGNLQTTSLVRAQGKTLTMSGPDSPATSAQLNDQDDGLDRSHLPRLHKSGGNSEPGWGRAALGVGHAEGL